MKEELLILLGAGATTPYIPNIEAITKSLINWQEFYEPDCISPEPPFLKQEASSSQSRTMLKYIYDEMCNYWTIKKPTFEELIHILECLDTIFPIPPNKRTIDEYRPMIGPFIQAKNSYLNIAHYYGLVATEASYKVLQLVKDASDRMDQNQYKSILAEGLAKLGENYNLKIFSLNYDDVPDRSGLPMSTGYYLNDGSPFDFDPRIVISGEDGHIHYQLHGSVLFGNMDIHNSWLIPRYHTRDDAEVNRQSTRRSFISAQDGHQSVPMPMISGLRKADKILYEPYASYVAALRHAAMSIPRWLIIGYGARDNYVNSILEISRNRMKNDPTNKSRIIVIDNYQFDDKDKVRVQLYGSLSNKLQNIITWSNNDLIQYYDNYNQYIHRKTFNSVATDIHISFDGVEWALSQGLLQVMSLLKG